jgi:hypothetical protein
MKAIPTRYKGVQFRSRLEARWAAMFDLLEWRWEYEPFDLEGYIPDFALTPKAGPVLVEVKPELMAKDLYAAAPKLDRAGWHSANENDALIVGASWNVRGDSVMGYPLLGVIRQSHNSGPSWCSAEWICCKYCGLPSTYHYACVWSCLMCGAGGKVYDQPPENLQAMWVAAGNIVQWKPPGRTR